MKRADYTRGNIAGVFLLSLFVAVIYFVWDVAPDAGRLTNYGFGPEWDCSHVRGTSALTCVRRPARRDAG